MAQSDDSGNKAKLFEFVCNALKTHEKEVDGLVDKLEKNKATFLAGITQLNSRLDEIAKRMDNLQNQFERLK